MNCEQCRVVMVCQHDIVTYSRSRGEGVTRKHKCPQCGQIQMEELTMPRSRADVQMVKEMRHFLTAVGLPANTPVWADQYR